MKVKILSPFRYEYQNKVLWLTTGEFYHLDKETDKEEIKYLLSDMFAYKEYIYMEKSDLDQSLIKEVVSEQGGSPALLQEEEVAPFINTSPSEETLTTPTQEPAANPFVDAASQVTYTEEAESTEPSTGEPAPATLAEEEALVTNDAQVEELPPEDNTEERQARKSHLQSMHWSKIKDVAEQHNLQYTEKAETIEAILNVEYP